MSVVNPVSPAPNEPLNAWTQAWDGALHLQQRWWAEWAEGVQLWTSWWLTPLPSLPPSPPAGESPPMH